MGKNKASKKHQDPVISFERMNTLLHENAYSIFNEINYYNYVLFKYIEAPSVNMK